MRHASCSLASHLALCASLQPYAGLESHRICEYPFAPKAFTTSRGARMSYLDEGPRSDEAVLMPLVARALGGSESTAAMSRTHAEIEHQVSRLRRLLTDLDNDTVQPEDVVELRRILYGLYGVLRLHNAQEEEGAFSLVPAGRARLGAVTSSPDGQG